MVNCILKSKSARTLFLLRLTLTLIFVLAASIFWHPATMLTVHAGSATNDLEAALYTHEEFFGSQALVPLPTVKARENVTKLVQISPDNTTILEKLANLDEQLRDFDAAEAVLKHLVDLDANRRFELANFYDRRARWSDEAAVLRAIVFDKDAVSRGPAFQRLLDVAKSHDLANYRSQQFYQDVVRADADVFQVFRELIERLTGDGSDNDALEYVRQAKELFPDNKMELEDKEILLLSTMGRDREAEEIYERSFDPFWSAERSNAFYEFLSEHDRLRDYGSALKARVARNQADFDAAIRYAHYQNYRSEPISPVFVRLEKAKKIWTSDELLTVTRMLLRANECDLASRFLYTLYNRGDLQKNSDLRGKILLQLFEMFSDAQTKRLPLTTGDLSFYQEAATIDTDPGISTGILSLIFSDTDPTAKFREKETEADTYFNRAAAYRIFLEYKQEFGTSPELAQMYLDIVRLYTATKNLDVAGATLKEFSDRYKNSDDFPAVALELAEAYAAAKDPENSRRVYREILDQLSDADDGSAADTAYSKNGATGTTPSTSPTALKDTPTGDQENEQDGIIRDHLGSGQPVVKYSQVFELLVVSLARESKTAEILELFSTEIAKHPNAEWLYEGRLSWLERTNLMDDELAVYHQAIAHFQSTAWTDKLARWFLRQNRQAEFKDLSTDLVSRLDDVEVQNYLITFIDSHGSATDFDKELYLQLYLMAHQRFPHNEEFVMGLLRFYRANECEDEWRKLAGEYYFVSKDVRKLFLDDLARRGELRGYAEKAPNDGQAYKLFRADAAIRLSNFEQAVDSYRELNSLYPATPEFADTLIALTRSFGQKDRGYLTETADLENTAAEASPSTADLRIKSGEIYAEMGDFDRAAAEWDKSIDTASGDPDAYLNAASVYWDYFQYDGALRTIGKMRDKFSDDTLCAFETGAVDEAVHKVPEAIGEYVKALGTNDQREKAKRRLAILVQRPGIPERLDAAFVKERGRTKDIASLSLGYADLLFSIKRPDAATKILNEAVASNRDEKFLESARDLYLDQRQVVGEQTVLKRLTEIEQGPRAAIKYGFQLAESQRASGDLAGARSTLSRLVARFPNNYGVVTGAADLYHCLGSDGDAINVLRSALSRSSKTYAPRIAGTLSKRLVETGHLDEAETVLVRLHDQNAADLDLFHDLANVYVREGRPDQLRTAFDSTVEALKRSDADRREIDQEVADFRIQMIDAFTKLKDYQAAVEQHIEIINRDPDDEEAVDAAIAYVQRYGGADDLLNYYKQTAAGAFKNYRWNVVLARIYRANNDLENAISNYRAAIVDQPEMDDLYGSVAQIEVMQHDFNGALRDLDTALQLTNDDPVYIKKKIDVLIKAGRNAEAEAERAKLPADDRPKIDDDRFAAARNLQGGDDKHEAKQQYRAAFDHMLEYPLDGELNTADIMGYVSTMRNDEPLQNINERLWSLRDKLIVSADEAKSTRAGDARQRLSVLQRAMIESVGNILKTTATDEELAAVHDDLLRRMEAVVSNSDQHGTLDLIRDISRRSGLGELEEQILKKEISEAAADLKQSHARDLIGFYSDRGAYEKALGIVQEYLPDDLHMTAEYARLAGSRNVEINALRAIYVKPEDKMRSDTSADVARYLDILYREDRDGLTALTTLSSVYQLQLINFLLGKGEGDLAQAAIENANEPDVWKRSRSAEAGLALSEFDADAKQRFDVVLRLTPIGEMIGQEMDKTQFPIGDDWFRLVGEYGKWLQHSQKKAISPSLYLAAMTEDDPKNADEHSKLGALYLGEKDYDRSIENFRVALELKPDSFAAKADLGEAYFLSGKRAGAEKLFAEAMDNSGPGDDLVFFNELSEAGLAEVARTKLIGNLVRFLEQNNADQSDEYGKMIAAIAGSFSNEDEKAAYFRDILDRRPSDTSLAKLLLDDGLMDNEHSDIFFERILTKNRDEDRYYDDYRFKDIVARTWSTADAESIYDQENDYDIEEPQNDRIEWQHKYLDSLIARGENSRAAALAEQIGKQLVGRCPEPVWLRIATLRLHQRAGRFDIAEAERLIGITVSDQVAEIKPPNIERFNEVIKMLTEEHAETAGLNVSESFFARNLALGQFDNANFDGLARALFRLGDGQQAAHILKLMVDAGDESTRAESLAEIGEIGPVKSHSVDTAKLGDADDADPSDGSQAMEVAATTAAEFGLTDVALSFRKRLADAAPEDADNKLKLAFLLAQGGDNDEAVSLANQLIDDRNAPRAKRWMARWNMRDFGREVSLNDIIFDPFSQYYLGLAAKEAGDRSNATAFMIDSLIAGGDQQAVDELIQLYATTDKPFAALRLAGVDYADKTDDVLRMLSVAAENTGDLARAIDIEKRRTDGGNADRLVDLGRRLRDSEKKAADMTVDGANTGSL